MTKGELLVGPMSWVAKSLSVLSWALFGPWTSACGCQAETLHWRELLAFKQVPKTLCSGTLRPPSGGSLSMNEVSCPRDWSPESSPG